MFRFYDLLECIRSKFFLDTLCFALILQLDSRFYGNDRVGAGMTGILFTNHRLSCLVKRGDFLRRESAVIDADFVERTSEMIADS